MKSYSVFLASEGVIKLQKDLSSTLLAPDGKEAGAIVCSNSEIALAGRAEPAHSGLQIEVRVREAANIKDAVLTAGNWAESTVSALVLESGGSQRPCQPILAYDVTPLTPEREFWQFFDVPLASRALRMSDPDAALELMEGISKLSIASEEPRLVRAILYLRRGFEIEDGLRRFEELWIGLECLNPLLQKMIATEPGTWKCDCGKEYSKQELRGLKAFVESVADKDTYQKIIRVRRDVFHGLASFLDAHQAAAELCPAVEQLLYKAIRFAVGMQIEDAQALTFRSLHGYSSPRMLVKGRLLNAENEPFGTLEGQPPHFVLDVKELPIEAGSSEQRIQYVFSPNIACDWSIDQMISPRPTGLKVLSHTVEAKLEDGTMVPVLPAGEDK
jgi:hypothetical protein